MSLMYRLLFAAILLWIISVFVRNYKQAQKDAEEAIITARESIDRTKEQTPSTSKQEDSYKLSPPSFSLYGGFKHRLLSEEEAQSMPDSVKTIVMSHQDKPDLKALFRDYTKIRFLNITWSNIERVPHEIKNLSRLSSLILAEVNLKHLPRSLTDLHNLRYLNLDGNDLNTFEELFINLASLEKLEELSLINNKMSVLPPAIGVFKNLRTLNLKDNQLRVLPESIAHCKSLEIINLEGNPIKTQERLKIVKLLPNTQVIF